MVRNATDEILVSYAFDVSMWHGVPFLTYCKVFTQMGSNETSTEIISMMAVGME